MNKIILITLLTSMGLFVMAQDKPMNLEQELAKSLQNANRSKKERARDESRKPIETLAFFGIEPEWQVLELIPGRRGWYTNILQHYIKAGNFSVAINTKGIEPLIKKYNWNVKIVDAQIKQLGKGYPVRYEQVVLPSNSFDAVLTFRNYHNFDVATRKKVNQAVFDTLKPGGIYGVIGHTGRHNAPATKDTWRRVDPVLAIKEMLDLGFEFVAYSDIHYREFDDLTKDTTHISIQSDSDRFTLKFRKPLTK